MAQKYYYTGKTSAAHYGDFVEDNLISKSTADRTFLDVNTSTSVRSEFLRSDYDYYRQNEKIPSDIRGIIDFAMKAYSRISIVRNVIDLMSDFGSQGIRLQHPNKRIERFYNQWFKKVKGKERSERMLNMLYRVGNVIVKRVDGKINKRKTQDWKKANAEEEAPIIRNEIPMRYDILNPLSIRVVNESLASFIGKPIYALLLRNFSSDIKVLQNAKVAIDLPKDIMNAVKKGKNEIILDQNKLHVYHYKKDDWQIWAEPIIYSLADDLVTFEKMRLADLASLDGAISNIRLWTVGFIDPSNPANNLIPTRATINKVRNILANAIGGGQMDLVWGPDLKFQESSSQAYRFLGKEKYEVTLNNIYDGLGIPPTLRSGGGSKNGGSTSFIALKTLIERLQYGRDRLVEFWDEQIKRVQKAMGFAAPAKVVFDRIIMSDESTELNLLINLVDRDLISVESLLERFDFLPEIEKVRIKKELGERGNKMPDKAGPYHNPQWDSRIKEALVLQGLISPDQIGIDVDGKIKPMPQPAGRPNNVQETKKRKPKPIRPQTQKTHAMSDMIIWANNAYQIISDIISPALLKSYKKSNYRQLSNDQAIAVELVKFGVLCGLDPYSKVSKDCVYNLLDKEIPEQYLQAYSSLVKLFRESNNREPSLDEIRKLYANAYVVEKIYG